MVRPSSINPQIVEALYCEALVLADAARSGFDELRESAGGHGQDCPDGVEVMCEALCTTTRVMHCLAWLLNHRAWLAGDISAIELRRHGRLIVRYPASDPAIVGRLPVDLANLVHQTERLYARIQRLETAWSNEPRPCELERLHERLAVAALRTG